MTTAQKAKTVENAINGGQRLYLAVRRGKIEVDAGGDRVSFSPKELRALAKAMLYASLTGWLTSSSMDFSDEDGWPSEVASNDLHDEMESVWKSLPVARQKKIAKQAQRNENA